jgi:hypothetical protein
LFDAPAITYIRRRLFVLSDFERTCFMRRSYLLILSFALVTGGLVLWLGRGQIQARYFVYQLVRAEGENRDQWINRISVLDEAALSSLVDGLKRNDELACENLSKALQALADNWGLENSRTVSLSVRLANAFSGMSAAGQVQVLKLERGWFSIRDDDAPRLIEISHQASRLLVPAVQSDNSPVRAMALALAEKLMIRETLEQKILEDCREMARAGLTDAEPNNRVLAIKLAQIPTLNLLIEVVPCMRDQSVVVRRAAILALGPAPEVINDDTLFYWLSDPDIEVRELCEVALRGRGLQDHHIRLARIMADPRPTVRMQVIETIDQALDLDPGVWLRRLSHDPSPAVRAAAARAAAGQSQVDLSDRIDQMAQTDPSPTVQQVARYYLSCHRLRAVQSEKP